MRDYYHGYRNDVVNLIIGSAEHSPNRAHIINFKRMMDVYSRVYEGTHDAADVVEIETMLGMPLPTDHDERATTLEMFAEKIVNDHEQFIITYLNTLPVIIDTEGVYVTRSGKRVRINEVRPTKSLDTTAFNALGSVEKMFRGKLSFREHGSWHVSGRTSALKEKGSDIVAKWSETTVAKG